MPTKILPVIKYIVGLALDVLSKFKKIFLIRRNGIYYQVDITESVDRAIFLRGWEPNTISILHQLIGSGDTVIEVGANIGAHSLIISKIIGNDGRLISIEPTSYAFNKLQKNFNLNPSLKVNTTLLQTYISNNDNEKVQKIRSSWQIHESNQSKEERDEQYDGEVTSLDRLFNDISNVNFLKIDVDGFDYKVLSGARKLINNFKPIVFIELGEYHLNLNGDSALDILKFFSKSNYEGVLETGETIESEHKVLSILKKQSHINAIFSYKNH